MPKITLPDGSERQYAKAVTGLEIAESIGKSLARDAVAIRVNDKLWLFADFEWMQDWD